ncbi:3-dehydroquinate synthase [Candidatus Woesearchaeota archaeon]|nr:3-dehydroquinate synthase [Candidatus Woesearchaeota archaeon]MDP6647917.1 3-dehydroquinate synthase [Candidatus Woesearchaeota archaeon]|tara:strand:- start:7157 stop:8260 length:1104 start_codon:yes stop_codon:yes gene_type:complete
MEEIKVEIKTKDVTYPVFIGSSIIAKIPNFIRDNHGGYKAVIITDNTVNELHKNKILSVLKILNPFIVSIAAGESSKSRKVKEEIEDKLLDKGFGRDTVVIALGGGVIGDLAGFVASTYNRGIPYVQIPTTLLSMVDSSIGGKTSVNTKHGKNLIGTFYQPCAVFADLDFLDTLPNDEFLSGLVETIKISIIKDKGLFNFLKKNHSKILNKDKDTLLYVVKQSVELKRRIAEADEKETGLRQILNFGHTFGHALETYSDFKIKHGFCVSQGIAVESKISVLMGHLNADEEKEIISLLGSYGLPTEIENKIDIDKLLEIMRIDKKNKSQVPRFVSVDRIGSVISKENKFSFEVEGEVIRKSIDLCKND